MIVAMTMHTISDVVIPELVVSIWPAGWAVEMGVVLGVVSEGDPPVVVVALQTWSVQKPWPNWAASDSKGVLSKRHVHCIVCTFLAKKPVQMILVESMNEAKT